MTEEVVAAQVLAEKAASGFG